MTRPLRTAFDDFHATCCVYEPHARVTVLYLHMARKALKQLDFEAYAHCRKVWRHHIRLMLTDPRPNPMNLQIYGRRVKCTTWQIFNGDGGYDVL